MFKSICWRFQIRVADNLLYKYDTITIEIIFPQLYLIILDKFVIIAMV